MGGFDYPNGFVYDGGMTPDAFGTGVAGAFVAIYLLIMLFSFAVSIAVYVLHSLGLYTIAQRRGLKHAWLSWIPFGIVWILGSISDQYQYVVKGRVKNRRKAMLALAIAATMVYIIWFAALIMSAIMGDSLMAMFGFAGGFILLMIVALVSIILQYICYYDLYRSCQPSNAVLYLILSIVVSGILPIFVFVCRKNDLGMPPRKQQPVQTFVSPVQQPYTSPVQTYAPPVYAPPVQTYTPPVQPFAAPVQEQPAEIVEEPADGFAQPEEFEE